MDFSRVYKITDRDGYERNVYKIYVYDMELEKTFIYLPEHVILEVAEEIKERKEDKKC